MPDNSNNQGTGDQGTKDQSTGYSAEYIKNLRDEAATWRTKLRETEAKVAELTATINGERIANTVGKELEKRGIKCDPSWVKMEEGQTPEKAVDKFLKDYPQLAQVAEVPIIPKNKNLRPMGANLPDSNIENTAKSELDAIKKDPIAREKLRNLYRGLLAKSAGASNYIQ
jgi:hypothetical protein